MRYIFILLLVFIISACGGKGNKNEETKAFNPTDTLDKLLSIKNEAELIERFGAENVVWDTVFLAEGFKSMSTLLYKGTCDQVEIIWKNSKTKEGVKKVTLKAMYDETEEKYIAFSHWKTSYNIMLGTTLKELQDLNGTPFIFLGFGWDYGGYITEFNGGNLSKLPIELHLEYVNNKNGITNSDYDMLMGDNEYNSDDAEAQRLNPVVVSISIINK